MTKLNTLVLFSAMAFSSHSFAHAGHDHNSPLAGLLHLLWLSPIALAAFIYFRQEKRQKNKLEQLKEQGE